jgi:hypothetical protein
MGEEMFRSILIIGAEILLAAFILTWQDIRFLKKDVRRLEATVDKLQSEIIEVKYRREK